MFRTASNTTQVEVHGLSAAPVVALAVIFLLRLIDSLSPIIGPVRLALGAPAVVLAVNMVTFRALLG